MNTGENLTPDKTENNTDQITEEKKTPAEKFDEWLDAGGRLDAEEDRNEIVAKHAVADSIFTNLFRIPKYALQLYQSLHPEDTETTEETLKTVTLTNVLVNGQHNDLGLLAEKKRLLVLYEAQSTWSLNVLVRVPGYWALTLHRYICETGQDLYGSSRVDVPVPEFYMIYTGERKTHPDVLRLSRDFFEMENTAVDITVKVLYGGREGDILSQYVRFTQIYREQFRLYGRSRRTVLETIRICIEENVLREYLESRREEAITVMMTLFDQATAVEAMKKSVEKAAEKRGEKRGETRGEKRVSKLHQKLLSEGRMADLQRSVVDEEYQHGLLKKYGI